MKKQCLLAVGMLLIASAQARTTLYGEVAATSQAKFDTNGVVLLIDGAGSEFGFTGEHALTRSEKLEFDIKMTLDVLQPSAVRLADGFVDIRGDFGSVGFYNGASPATQSTQLLNLMNNDPDSNGFALGSTHRIGNMSYAPIGINNSTGIRYQSPLLDGGIAFAGSVVPSGSVNAPTGVSMVGQYQSRGIDVSLGFELNVEQANSQLFRLAGEIPAGNAKLGGILQLASNSDLDASIRSTVGYVKFPLLWANFKTNNQLIFSLTARKNSAEQTDSHGYVSFVQEIPWSAKVSSFAFADSLLTNEFNDVTTWVGGGLRVKF